MAEPPYGTTSTPTGGTYANNGTAAISATGTGEFFILAMPFNAEGMDRGHVRRDGEVVTKIYGDE